jgi:hypothetical protein
VKHRSAKAQAHLTVIRALAGLVRARTALINVARGLLGCFLETLGRFRIDPKLLAELAEIEEEDDYCPLGEVPLEGGEKRVLGVATAGGEYADICSSGGSGDCGPCWQLIW